MNFSTRTLLAITAWAAVCYAMAFAIPPNLLAFYAARFIAYFVVLLSVALPLFLEFQYRRFWIAYSLVTFGCLMFFLMNVTSNPLAVLAVDALSNIMGLDKQAALQMAGENFGDQIISSHMAIYYVMEINLIIAMGALGGVIWQMLDRQTPWWALGSWAFLFALAISIGNWQIMNVAEFLTVVVIVLILPACLIEDGKLKPFWTAFAIVGCGFIIQFGPIARAVGMSPFFSRIVTDYLPNIPIRSGGLLLIGCVPIIALIGGGVVQSVVNYERMTNVQAHRAK